MSIKISVLFIFLVCAVQVMAQEITGTVVGQDNGQPLSGATVHFTQSGRSASTDAQGRFLLSGSLPDTLIVSFIGYLSQRVPVINPASPLRITLLPDAEALDAVVVHTGYQKMRPNEVNGAVTVIDQKTLNEQTGTSILERLNGVTPALLFKSGKNGSDPNTPAGLSVRGESTINGPLDPLIILDDFPYEGDIANINPNDVASVTVLKDAAATSIYGARGGNGVIVITTRRGRFGQRLSVSFNANLILTQPTDLSGAQQLSSAEYIDVETWLFGKGYYNALLNLSTRRSLSPVVELLAARRSGLISAEDSARQIEAYAGIDSRDQYKQYFYRHGAVQQYALSLSGGSDQMAWTLAGNYDRSLSMLSARNDKINLRLNNSFRPLKGLNITTGVYFTHNNSAGPGAPAYGSVRVNGRFVPYLAFADADGAPLPVAKEYRSVYTDTAGRGRLLDWNYYPLTDHLHDRTRGTREEMLANIGLNYRLLKGLDLDVKYQYQQQRSASERVADMESYATRDLINRFTQLGATAATDTFRVPRGSSITRNGSVLRSQNLRAQLNFQRSYGQHSVSALGGFELRSVTAESGAGYTLYGYATQPLRTVPVDFVHRYPTFITGSLATIPGTPRMDGRGHTRFVSTYANFSYGYRQRYSVSASFRRDASNTFGLKTNDKWNPFWSAGAGWELSKEAFYRFKPFSYLKLRATVGYSGNLDPSRTAEAVLLYGTDVITSFPLATVNTLNNPELRWEKIRQVNFGVDFRSRNNRFSGSLDAYQKDGRDLYGEAPYNYTAWGARDVLTRNVANMRGRGIELSLQSRNLTGPVQWTTTLLLNHVTNTTTAYFGDGASDLSRMVSSGNNITPIVGKPLYGLAAYRWGGLSATGDPQGYLNGALSTDYNAIRREAVEKGAAGSIEFIGPSNPTLYGAVGNSVSYKGWRLSVNLQYSLGYYFRKAALSYNALYVGGIGHPEFSRRWQAPGDEANTNVPAMVYSNYPQFSARDIFYGNSSLHVLPGGHLRLQFVNLSYSYGKATLYGNAANLGLLWTANKEGIDPSNPDGLVPGSQFTLGLRMNL